MSTEAWKLEKDLCRCCHAEGSFHNLAEPRYKLGEEEVYSEMLRYSFDVNLSPVTGLLCSMTFTICESCILRLRDATNFKRQVLMCEDRFKDMYSNVMKALNPGLHPTFEVKVESSNVVTQEEIKEEYLQLSDNDDTFDVEMSVDEDDDDDDKTVLQVKLDNAKKAKAKAKAKPKPKVKILPEKKTVRPKKKTEKTETAAKAEDKPKKGEGVTLPYTVKKADDGSVYLVCDICDRVFQKRGNFHQHYTQVHLKRRPKLRACHRCDVKVPGYLRAAHMETAHGIPAPKCLACDRKFAYPHLVIKHQKTHHMGEKNFKCNICDMTFTMRNGLTNHMIKHTQIRNFVCDYCGKAFRWKGNVRSHILMHMNIRRFVCQVCNEAFVQRSSLSYHTMKYHPDLV